jgi:MSHA pilin protein MshC
MVIMGILAAVAVPRLVGRTETASRAFHTDVLSAMRYAQKVASTHLRLVCANVTASNVSLNITSTNPVVPPATNCDVALASPDGKPYASQNAAVTASGPLLGTLFFQPTGLITSDALGTTIVSGQIAITDAAPIRIDGATGYVE